MGNAGTPQCSNCCQNKPIDGTQIFPQALTTAEQHSTQVLHADTDIIIHGIVLDDDGTVQADAEATRWAHDEDDPKAAGKQANQRELALYIDESVLQRAITPFRINQINESVSASNQANLFRFRTNARYRCVAINHKDCVWSVLLDGRVVGQLEHSVLAKDRAMLHRIQFQVAEFEEEAGLSQEERQGKTLPASCCVRWSTTQFRWTYAVEVNSMPIPAFGNTLVQFAYVPDVVDLDRNLYSSEDIAKSNREYLSITDPENHAQSNLKTTRVFCFVLHNEVRSIEVAHENTCWYVFVDGVEVKRLEHNCPGFGEILVTSIRSRAKAGLTGDRSNGHTGAQGDKFVFGCDFPVKSANSEEFVPECRCNGNPSNPKRRHFTIDIPKVAEELPVLAISNSPAEAQESSWNSVDWESHERAHVERLQQDLNLQLGESPKAARVYQFTTHLRLRSVALLHTGCKWKLVADGQLVKELAHPSNMLSSMHFSMDFEIPMEGEDNLKAIMDMDWKPADLRWTYTLFINGIRIEPVYSNVSTDTAGIIEVADYREPLLALSRIAGLMLQS